MGTSRAVPRQYREKAHPFLSDFKAFKYHDSMLGRDFLVVFPTTSMGTKDTREDVRVYARSKDIVGEGYWNECKYDDDTMTTFLADFALRVLDDPKSIEDFHPPEED